MSIGMPLNRTHFRPFVSCMAALLFLLSIGDAVVFAQTEALARRWADARVQTEEIRYLFQSQQITADEARARTDAVNKELLAIRSLMNPLPRQTQADISREQETLFQTRIVPLREQWNQALQQKRQQDQAADAQRRVQLQAEADTSGKLQAARTLLRERAQRGEISQAELQRNDQIAEQQILALHHKYDAFGPQWGALFSQTEAAVAARTLVDTRLKLRLDDTQSEVGKDAHRAADLTLSMQRNQVFQALQAMTPQEAQNLNTTAQTLLTSLQQKYGPTSPNSADFRDRVARLVQAGAAQRPQWERDAAGAREARRTAAAAPPPSTPAIPPVQSIDYPPPTQTSAGAPRPTGAPGPTAAPSSARRQSSTPRQQQAAAPRPPVFVPISQPPQVPARSINWTPILIFVLVVGGAGASFVTLRSGRKPAPPRYAPIEVAKLPAPASAQRTVASSAPLPSPATDDLKGRLFAEQRQKYQSRYNDAQDDVTNASMVLTQLAPILAATQANLQLLSKGLHDRIRSLIVSRQGGTLKLLTSAALLTPLWRLFKRVRLIGKLIIAAALWYVVLLPVVNFGIAGQWPVVLVTYVIAVVVLFLIERHVKLKVPLAVLKRGSEELKATKLAYIFTDQRPDVINGGPVLHAVRVYANDKSPIAHDTYYEDSLGTGTFMVNVGAMANYRIDQSGNVALIGGQQNEFMNVHTNLLTEAMGEQSVFAANTLPAFAQYGQAVWQKRRAASLVPQLEQLVRDVDRIEELWKDTYVSDQVFEALFRSIDMFNVRDSATPPGLLLYGPSGNGKKHLARKIADTLSARFEQVNPSKLGSADDIQALWKSNLGGDPVVLFVPNADTVFQRPTGGAPSSKETLEWITEWEKHEPHQSRVWVVMTAQSDQGVDQAILDFLGQDSQLEIKAPDAPGRTLVLRLACHQYQLPEPPDSVIKATGGANIQDLRRIAMAAKRASAPHAPQETHWLAAVKTVRGGDKFRDPTKTWERIILPQKVKQRLQVACKILQDAQEFAKRGVSVPNILLYGPPGTGKTDIARTIANEGGVNFMGQKASDLKGEYLGQGVQNVKRMFDKARASAPTVLFIDEMDGVAPKRGGRSEDVLTKEIVTELLAQMDGATKSERPVFILAATNAPETIDNAILERFEQRIEIPLPDEDGRRQIFKGLLKDKPLEAGLDIDELSAAVAKRTNGYSGRALVKMLDRALGRAVALAGSASNFALTRALVLEEVEELAKSSSDKVDESATWKTLVVSDHTLGQLQELSNALRHMETLQRQGIDPPRGAVLWGPPGTGKTQIAKTLANESDIRFLFKGPSDLGHSAETVRALFDEARTKAPCILFIDEFENAAKSRESGGSAEVVTELLSQMQGAKKTDRPVFVLAATNYLDTIDDAILSRFTYRIEVPSPTLEQREKLFAIFLNKYPRADFDIAEVAAELARKGGGLAGRDINDVIVRASQAAAQRALRAGTPDKVALTRDDLLKEVADMVKSRSDAVDATARWETLVLGDDTIKTLKQITTALRNMDDRLKQGIEPPRGAVLFGPPGTGKTQIARTLANESGVQFVSATAKDVTGQYVGESTQKVAKLFADARKKAPCILFIDEFDNAASSRSGSKGSGFAGEVVTQLLAEMDGVKATGRPIFVLAATNYLEHIDEAVLSRFTYRVEVPNPTPEQRERLFAIFLGKYKRVAFDVRQMSAELAKRSGDIGGRQIGDLVRKAAQAAAQRAEDAGMSNEIVISREDLLSQLAPAGRPVADVDLDQIWAGIVLRPDVKESLLGMIRLFNGGSKAAPTGLLLYGPPGTGKTEIARLLAKSTGCEFLANDLTTLKGSHIGESGEKVKAVWEKARTRGRAIIFVDECDGVFARRGGTNTDAAVEEITNAFLPMWDGVDSKGQIWVVGATNKRDRIDEALDSRFGVAIEIGLPGPAERTEILKLELRKLESTIQVPEFAGEATSGFAGRNLSKVAATVFRLAAQRGGASDDIWREAIAQFAKSSSDAVDAGARWESLILPDATLKRLRRVAEMLKHAEALREQGIDPPRGALLFGPPGTGKTQIAKTLANESGLAFIAAGPSDIKAGYLGQSGQKVRELFERARAKPTILFIDEIESGAASRNSGKADQFTGEIVTELLTQMEGVKKVTGTLFVLAATNHPNLVDDAVLSRFEDRIEIPNPGLEQRKRMLKTFIGKRRVDFDVDQVADEVAMRTEGLSGRDLMSVVRRASQQSAERAMDAGTPGNIVMSRDDLLGQLSLSSFESA